MERYFDVVTDRRGNAISGATVTIKTEAGSNATIFSDDGVTTAANPQTTNADGEYTFFAANGKYTVQIVAEGYGSENKSDQILFDPADMPYSALAPAASSLTAVPGQHARVNAGGTALEFVPDGRMRVREVNTATYALTAGDAGQWLDVTAAATATLSLSTAQPFAVGDTVIIRQRGAGQVVLSAGSSVTLDSALAAKTYAQKSVIALTQIETARWSVYGDMAVS